MAVAFTALNASAGILGVKPIVNGPKCFGTSTGSISLNVAGGQAPYSFTWSNGPAHGSAQYNLPAGTYQITVTDQLGNQAVSTINMGQNEKMNLSTSTVNVSQPGGTDGCIHLAVSGGTPDFTYNWSNGSTEQSPCGLTAGTYYVTVTDGFGCVATTSKQLSRSYQKPDSKFNTNINSSGFEPSAPGNTENDKRSLSADNTSESATELEVLVYPNPSSNFLSVRTGSTKGEISLMSMTGQTLIHKYVETTEATLDVSDLAKGNYIVAVKTENGISNKMISVAK